ncbi:MAG: histidinol-phosphate transaminase [Deltaproteobacteria bacterium]|nr:histidinol-phosphate transaminase [Candidatus Zymogenaceae bacterium]
MIKKHVPDYIQTLTPYPPGKPIEELERELGITGSIKLASNENPLGPSPKALAAIEKRTKDLHRYPDGSSYYLKERLSQHLGVGSDHLVIGNGSNEIIEFLIRLLVRVGDEVVMGDPSFIVYRLINQAVGGKNVIIPLKDWNFDLDAMKAAITDRTRLVFIDCPNNPVGTTVKQSDFARFMEGLPEHLLVVLDEAYQDFVTDTNAVNFFSFMDKGHTVISLRTFSKAYGLSGLRVGYGIAAPGIMSMLERVRQPFNINSLAQAAATAALDDEQFLQHTLSITREGLSYLYGQFEEMGLSYVPSQTNFVLVDVGRPANEVYQAMLREGVIVRSMASYGLKTYERITVGTMKENERFIRALKKVLDKG